MTFEKVTIRETTEIDLDDIIQVETIAFGQDEEAILVSDLLSDTTAKPTLSLLAFCESKPVGHVMFSRVYVKNSQHQPLMHILAPLAVIPSFQRKGIGGKLINKGIETLKARGSELVFVLGHETYYPKFGFIPNAGKFGFAPPYPIAEKHVNAWMFQWLNKEKQNSCSGKITCADVLNNPKYWVD
ncbi:MAG: N-acetyltransferase [Bacteroidia bacterium]|nr:N-acetyltransferase [Bacteroidia bacterium]